MILSSIAITQKEWDENIFRAKRLSLTDATNCVMILLICEQRHIGPKYVVLFQIKFKINQCGCQLSSLRFTGIPLLYTLQRSIWVWTWTKKYPTFLTILISHKTFTLLEVFLGRLGFFSLSSDDCDIFRLRGFAKTTGDLPKQELLTSFESYSIKLCDLTLL